MKKVIIVGFAVFMALSMYAQQKVVVYTDFQDKQQASDEVVAILEDKGFTINESTRSKVIAYRTPVSPDGKGGRMAPDGQKGQTPSGENRQGAGDMGGGMGGPGGMGAGMGGPGGMGGGFGGDMQSQRSQYDLDSMVKAKISRKANVVIVTLSGARQKASRKKSKYDNQMPHNPQGGPMAVNLDEIANMIPNTGIDHVTK